MLSWQPTPGAGRRISMRSEALTVGELARRTGLPVRTLHHYDAIGLVRPSLRTEPGHRLYTPADVARLQQVVSLRQLGFSLEEIGDCLGHPPFPPPPPPRLPLSHRPVQIPPSHHCCHAPD